MTKYTEFAQENPTLDRGMDLVDYMWRTNSAIISEDPELWPEAIVLRKVLFNALDRLPGEGPTFEDACLIGKVLPVYQREGKYVTDEIRRKRQHRFTARFWPLPDYLFQELVMYQAIKSLGREERDHVLDKVAGKGAEYHSSFILMGIFGELDQAKKDNVKRDYNIWRDRESPRRLVVKREIDRTGPSMELIKKLEEEHDFDFGNFPIEDVGKYIGDGVHNVGVTIGKFFSYLE